MLFCEDICNVETSILLPGLQDLVFDA